MISDKRLTETKKTFCQILRSTNRMGIERVVTELEKSAFFTAPASRRDHMACEGGLMQHSMNVYRMAMLIVKDLRLLRTDLPVSDDSIAIAALLHDVCKSTRYSANPDTTAKEKYLKSHSHLPIGHGEKSVIMLLRMGLQLTDDEILAIRWHMSPWDLPLTNAELSEDYRQAENTCPLVAIIQAADKLAAKALEI